MPSSDLREALDKAQIALGVVYAQEKTGHDESTYRIVKGAFDFAGVVLRGSKPEFPRSPIGGIVRGRHRCRCCGLRAYKWVVQRSAQGLRGDAEMRCVGCDTRHRCEAPDSEKVQHYLTLVDGLLGLRALGPLSDRTEGEVAEIHAELWDALTEEEQADVERGIEALKERWGER